MDTLAYLHLALTYEEPQADSRSEPETGRWFLAKTRGKTLVKRGQYCLLALGAAIGLLQSTPQALALVAKGDQNAEVTRVQKRLQELKFFQEQPTGYYGEVTVEAVKKFQRDRGMAADGIVGKQTEAALFGDTAHSDNPFNSDSFLSEGSESKPSRFTDARKLRREIVRPQSAQPQESFLSETLKPPAAILERELKARTANTRALQDRVRSQDITIAPSETPEQTPQAPAATKLLKIGARGESVRQLQGQLQSKGYVPGEIDGIYGRQTQKAVIAFQRSRGLEVDGVVGAQTQTALKTDAVQPSQRLYPKKIRNS